MKEKKQMVFIREIDDGDGDNRITKFEISLKCVTIEITNTREQAKDFAIQNGYDYKFI